MRGSGTWLATGLAGLALILGTQTPADAWAQPAASVSLDGEQWAASVERPLLDEDHRWVPGDTETVSIWVRNLSGTRADLELLTLVGSDDHWSSADLALTARINDRPAALDVHDVHDTLPADESQLHTFPDDTHKAVVVSVNSSSVEGAGPVRVDLTVTMPRRATNRTQEISTVVQLQARLTHATLATGPARESGAAPPAGLSEPVGGHLPDSGAPPFGLPLTLVAVSAATRAAVLGIRRRYGQHPRRHQLDHQHTEDQHTGGTAS